jgi:hypothetical protein
MTPKEYQVELKDLEVKIDRVRSLYDQYFRGFEKMPPGTLRKEVEGKIRNLSKVRMKNTALRFKLQVLIQKYTTFLAYWQRAIRDIEEGKLKRRKPEEEEDTGRFMEPIDLGEAAPRPEDALDIDIDVDLDDSEE